MRICKRLHNTRRRCNGGFTIIELLVVVAIIGILAAIALPRLFSAIQTAKEGRTYAHLRSLRGALSMYFLDHGIDAWNYYPWQMDQITACAIHTPPHSYIDHIPEEEVGDGEAAGDQITDWCVTDHSWHRNRSVQSVDDGSSPLVKGGWNYCIPNGAASPTAPPSGVVWIDEEGIGLGGVPFNEW